MTKAQLPPGFRFHPTDEELIVYYLRNQATSKPCPASIIPEIDIYKFDPWELPDKSEFSEKEWYFFSPRDRKYPNGVRPNRAAVSGYWKATGTDKAILSGTKYVGVKKALVFYKGKPPKGIKTDWIMHEYRLVDPNKQQPKSPIRSMRLDDWVLCRIYKKKQVGDRISEEENTEETETTPPMKLKTSKDYCSEDQKMSFSMEKMGSISHVLYENAYPSSFDLQYPMVGVGVGVGYGLKQDDDFSNPNFYDIGKFHVNDANLFNQPLLLMNPVAFD